MGVYYGMYFVRGGDGSHANALAGWLGRGEVKARPDPRARSGPIRTWKGRSGLAGARKDRATARQVQASRQGKARLARKRYDETGKRRQWDVHVHVLAVQVHVRLQMRAWEQARERVCRGRTFPKVASD